MAVLVELAERLRDVRGLRVLLVSVGAEEANQEGMLAFARRHFAALAREDTTFLCLDTVGSPELVLIEGEGFLRMRDYPGATKELVAEAARERGVPLRRGLWFTFATDGLIPLRAGYPVASVGSVNDTWSPRTTTGRPTRPSGCTTTRWLARWSWRTPLRTNWPCARPSCPC